MAKAFATRIELTSAARKSIVRLCEANGMTQVAALSRLVEWFVAQPELIRAGILGHYPTDLRLDVTKLILDRMANGAAASASAAVRKSKIERAV